MKLESAIQSKVIKELEAHGWYVVKLVQTNKNGIPDLIRIRKVAPYTWKSSGLTCGRHPCKIYGTVKSKATA